ncbi:MAG: hypothetical protein ABFS39_14755 [Pseudomonadota bacterium]
MVKKHNRTRTRGKLIFSVFFGFLWAAVLLTSCDVFYSNQESNEAEKDGKSYVVVDPLSVAPNPGEGGSAGTAGGQGSLEDDPQAAAPAAGGGTTSSTGDNTLKPVGFVNYGTFNATVRAWTFIPFGAVEPQSASAASTVSDAQTTGGDWPNTSRFLSVPMGTYTWCIDWEEEDKDEDGYFDYYHYITVEPTVLDENDSDELEFAEEVSISPPPLSAPVYEGKCNEHPIDDSCAGKSTEVNVYSIYALEEDNPPEEYAVANQAEGSPPVGVSLSVGSGTTTWGGNIILWQAGDWIEATTSNPYTAFGGQIHGDQTIGWARILFDGAQIWQGDTSTSMIADGRYGVYVEVRCFPPGTHTMRIEAVGQNGSGGGMSIPVSYFGFRK